MGSKEDRQKNSKIQRCFKSEEQYRYVTEWEFIQLSIIVNSRLSEPEPAPRNGAPCKAIAHGQSKKRYQCRILRSVRPVTPSGDSGAWASRVL